ncbi:MULTISPECIES: PAS domain-containing protein [Bosea]|uniref:Blue-light-activated histidine kinase n=1 Tax=Bosea robiniae TaxID=1036780 RepID=A0ABY0P652_9HYPH|nr:MULTISPECIES: PAS domain-containing protein [Bosea]TQI75315.1 PAS domain S-box-containing protein [Bosea sp. AK1]SDG83675.1 PAS domain S-box-containing protein [Bosea robiniae]
MPLNEALKQLRSREDELARVQRIGQIGGLEVDLREGAFRNQRSPEYLAVHGLPADAANESHEAWVARIHPEDRDRVVSHFQQSVDSFDTDYEVEYRIIRPSDGETRWILAKAEIQRDDLGKPIKLIGAHIDITARRTAEEQRELIARELQHRIGNIFSVVSSLISMGARAEPAAAKFADEIIGRLTALHRAHGIVLDKNGDESSDNLPDLIGRLIAPYNAEGSIRISVGGDKVRIGRSSSTSIALIIHELATNAVKHGALSIPTGNVRIEVKGSGEHVVLVWEERGGPAVVGSPHRQGFGSLLVDRAAKAQLGALMRFDWNPAGLVVQIEMSADKIGV